jgi:hypothetical protein
VTHPFPTALACRRSAAPWSILVLAIAAGIAMIGSRLIMKTAPGDALLWLAIILPLPFLAALIAVISRAARNLDEMYRRIQFEALALTVPTSALLLVLYGQLQKADILPLDDMALSYAVISLTYASCYFLAARRYH